MWWLALAWAGPTPLFDFDGVEIHGELERPTVSFVFVANRPYGEWSKRRLTRRERRLRRRGSSRGDARVQLAHVLARLAEHEELAYFEDLDGAGFDAEPPEEPTSIRARRAEAVQLLEASLVEPPDAELLLALSMLEEQLGGDGLAPLERLVLAEPDAPQAARAWVELGQAAFRDSDLGRARVSFGQVESMPAAEPEVKDFALYMLGWCAYNLGEFGTAQAYWADVSENATSPSLREEARRDLGRDLP